MKANFRDTLSKLISTVDCFCCAEQSWQVVLESSLALTIPPSQVSLQPRTYVEHIDNLTTIEHQDFLANLGVDILVSRKTHHRIILPKYGEESVAKPPLELQVHLKYYREKCETSQKEREILDLQFDEAQTEARELSMAAFQRHVELQGQVDALRQRNYFLEINLLQTQIWSAASKQVYPDVVGFPGLANTS